MVTINSSLDPPTAVESVRKGSSDDNSSSNRVFVSNSRKVFSTLPTKNYVSLSQVEVDRAI